MNLKTSFSQLAKQNKEILSRQSPVTLEQAKHQVKNLKVKSAQSSKKQSLSQRYHSVLE